MCAITIIALVLCKTSTVGIAYANITSSGFIMNNIPAYIILIKK